jgi:hypothetical protein
MHNLGSKVHNVSTTLPLAMADHNLHETTQVPSLLVNAALLMESVPNLKRERSSGFAILEIKRAKLFTARAAVLRSQRPLVNFVATLTFPQIAEA